MPLPVLDVPTYDLTLPSTDHQYKYRPFLVKEEKILLMAMEGEDETEILNAVCQIIGNCILDDNFNVDSLPLFDIEYIFLKLRAKSIGETSNLEFKCTECETSNKVTVDLSKIEILKSEDHTNKIEITNDVGAIMRYPTPKSMTTLSSPDGSVASAFEILEASVESIYQGDEVHDMEDYTFPEKREFFDSLTQEQFENIQKFMATMPKLEHDITFDCTKCSTTNKIKIEGLQNFFG